MVCTPPQTRPDVGGVRGTHQCAPGGEALAGWLAAFAGYALVRWRFAPQVSRARQRAELAGEHARANRAVACRAMLA